MRNIPLCSVCLLCFLFISVCVITGGAEFVQELRPTVLEEELSGNEFVRLSGQVYDIDNKEEYQILYLKNNSIIYQNESFKESKIIVYDGEKINIEIGNRIKAYGRISFYEEERNPGNFNQKLYYRKQGIHASIWGEEITVIDEHVNKFRNSLYEFRQTWKESLCEVLGEEDGNLLSAVLLGEKTEMDEYIKELYQVTGVAHVLAISGLHLSVIGVGLYKLIRRISGSYLAGGIAGTIFLMLYVLMIGMSVSVMRAFVMFLFRVGADMTGRHYDRLTALSAAALITIIWKPLYLYDGGFWLSYSAILAIIFVLPIFEKLLFQNVWASVSINLMTLPILLYNFYEISFYSVILNLIVVPLMSLVLLCGLTGSLLCEVFVFRNAGKLVLQICKMIFSFYEYLCEMFLSFPHARIVAGQPEIWQLIIYVCSILLLVVMWRRKRKWRMGAVMVTMAIILMLVPDVKDCVWKKEVEITVLDVGQGDSIFVKGPKGDTYLIDGGSSDVKKVGKYRIEPFLKSQGVRKLDYIFVSHGDNDHINGIVEMVERMDVGVAIETIVFPPLDVWNENLEELAKKAMKNGVGVVVMGEGQRVEESEMTITCLAPGDGYVKQCPDEAGNKASMVLALNYGEFDMLLTGDVEEEGEELLTEVLEEKYTDVNWEVLKVAHHGSKNSSKEEFLDVVEPIFSIISAGRENSYGHPHEETLVRLSDVGSRVATTQKCGAVIIATNGRKMKIEGYLSSE